jgi:hypothetical protein
LASENKRILGLEGSLKIILGSEHRGSYFMMEMRGCAEHCWDEETFPFLAEEVLLYISSLLTQNFRESFQTDHYE